MKVPPLCAANSVTLIGKIVPYFFFVAEGDFFEYPFPYLMILYFPLNENPPVGTAGNTFRPHPRPCCRYGLAVERIYSASAHVFSFAVVRVVIVYMIFLIFFCGRFPPGNRGAGLCSRYSFFCPEQGKPPLPKK